MSECIREFYIENGEIRSIDNWVEEREGKMVYEVMRIINGRPLFYDEHYDRMINSFKISKFKFEFDRNQIRNYIEELVSENKIKIGNIKITYNMQTKTLRIFLIKHKYPTEDMYREGVKTVLYFGERENPNAKVINNSFREGVNNRLKETDSYEGILVDRNNYITEGSRSNIFMIKNNSIYTSKIEAVLPGVTRNEIICVAKENGIEVIEENVKYTELEMFDALFISGTSPNILPIKSVGELKFNVKNTLLRELMRLFNEKIAKSIEE
ncbi:aminotransferase class IV [Clostridium paraputrificum]|uniref:aminotransferase class IV n=1 Tax=Clostridium TaxID=1485 RepID=UPI003D32A385